MKTKIKLNEIEHKSYIGNFVFKHKSINIQELKRIKPEIEQQIDDWEKPSILNSGITKKHVFNLFFSFENKKDDEILNYMVYNNFLREFIEKRKGYKLPSEKRKI